VEHAVTGLTTVGELVRLEVPALPAFVGVARSVVAAVASAVDGIDEDRLEDLRVAVSEAVTNAVESHRRDAVDDVVIITCHRDGSDLHVVIEDRGSGIDISDVPAPPGPDAPPTASERGWGVQLIQALVDDVSFEQSDSGTRVDLVVHLDLAG
jgi:serine/threonine-protein kinase RsbW